MALSKWGFIYTLAPDEPIRRDEIGTESCRLIAVGVPTADLASETCVELVSEGCELVEFCGAFGASQMSQVQQALSGSGVPVGVVTYGGDATAGLHQLFNTP